MKKCVNLASKLLNRLQQQAQEEKKIRVDLKFPPEGTSEEFHVDYRAKSLTINANSAIAAVYALAQFSLFLPSGYWGDFLGRSSPRYPLRILWLDQHFLHYEACWEQAAAKVLELGYNSLLLHCEDIEAHSGGLRRLSEILREYGIKFIFKPSPPSPTADRAAYLGRLLQFVEKPDFLFWESSLTAQSVHEKDTFTEVLAREISFLEKSLPSSTSLIYYLPPLHSHPRQHAERLHKLLDEAGKKTLIAFPALAGEVAWDHLPLHPLWDMLRKSPDESGTRLLPIINAGAVNQGEGLWPCWSLDLLEKGWSKCYRHPFAGAICYSRQLPQTGGLLECNLWVAGQMLWRPLAPQVLAETWFCSRHEEKDRELATTVFALVRETALELSKLRFAASDNKTSAAHDEVKSTVEHILCNLSHLQHLSKLSEGKFWELPLSCFLSDCRRLVKQLGLQLGIAAAQIVEEGKLFLWTEGSGKGGSAAAFLLKQPISNEITLPIISGNFFS